MGKFQNFFNTKEKIIIFGTIFSILILHSVIASMHFHECDSSDVYRYLKDSSIFSKVNFIRHIGKTGSIFFPVRIFLGLIASLIPLNFIRSTILLPLKMTYTPLSGFIYGMYLPDGFGKFYEYASLMNIIFIVIGILIFYNSLKYVGVKSIIAFCCSFGILSFYSINSYTYHLGSTVWFLFGSLISIPSSIYFHKKISKYGFCLALAASYPSMVHFISHNIYLFFYRISGNKIFSRTFKKDILINKLYLIIKSYQEPFIVLGFLIVLFFPFNSGYRTPIDYRGLFTPFAPLPLYSEIDLKTFLISIVCFILCLYTVYKRYKNTIILQISYKRSKSLKAGIDITLLNLIFIFLLITFEKLTFGTTRHSLFLMPYIFFLVAVGIQLLLIDIKKTFNLAKFIQILLLFLFFLLTITSLYSSYLRFDHLKTETIPKRIREFAATNNTNSITLLDCDFHFTNNDFTKRRATYNKKDPLTSLPLNYVGSRLLVTQTIKGIENFSLDLRKGDELITKFKDVKIELIEDPYFIEKRIFYDAMNFDKNSNEYIKRNNGYSRPNSIYIFPIKVTSKIK